MIHPTPALINVTEEHHFLLLRHLGNGALTLVPSSAAELKATSDPGQSFARGKESRDEMQVGIPSRGSPCLRRRKHPRGVFLGGERQTDADVLWKLAILRRLRRTHASQIAAEFLNDRRSYEVTQTQSYFVPADPLLMGDDANYCSSMVPAMSPRRHKRTHRNRHVNASIHTCLYSISIYVTI